VWVKFLNNCWKCTWHSLIFILEVYDLCHIGLLHNVLWPFGKTKSMLVNSLEQQMPGAVVMLFLLQFSYYLADVLYWIIVNPPPDLAMMGIHHLASVLLICLSGIQWPKAHF